MIRRKIKIAKYLGKHNAKKYVIQQYKRIEGIAVIPFSEEKMNEILKQCNQYVKTEGRGWKM